MEREVNIRQFGISIEKSIYDKVYQFGIEDAKCYCFLNKEKLRKLAVETIRAIKNGMEENVIVTKGIFNLEVAKDSCNVNFVRCPSYCVDKNDFDKLMRVVLRTINETD